MRHQFGRGPEGHMLSSMDYYTHMKPNGKSSAAMSLAKAKKSKSDKTSTV